MKILIPLAFGATLLASAAQAQPDARGAEAPRGDYWRTCRDVSTYGFGEDATMTARCQDERGRWRATTLRFGRCRDVENRDGDLVCAEGRPGWGDRPGDRSGDRPGDGRPPWAGGGESRPPWAGGGDRGGYGRNSITLFSAPNFGGRPFEARDEITNLPKQYNDHAMSLRIQGRGAWQVCSDSDFRGRCQVFDRDVPDLRQYGLGEAVTSMRPVR